MNEFCFKSSRYISFGVKKKVNHQIRYSARLPGTTIDWQSVVELAPQKQYLLH